MLELKNIKKYYTMGENVVKALDDVSLVVKNGEFVTIVGPSGSGKSTLMNIVGCLDIATEGQYFIDGVEISKFSENQLAFLRNKTMGFIFQGFNLLSNLTAYENVELPLIYQGISKSERKLRVIEALEKVGMKDRMKHKPAELSGGQQQRVAIARALATHPECILADEPTGNLDSATGDEIMKILAELNENGTTIIIITHNDEIAKLSRRVVRIHDGKIESDKINQNIASYGEKNLKNSKSETISPIKLEKQDVIEVSSAVQETSSKSKTVSSVAHGISENSQEVSSKSQEKSSETQKVSSNSQKETESKSAEKKYLIKSKHKKQSKEEV